MISDPKLFVLVFAAFFLISFLITKFVRRVAFELGIQDIPDSDRKIHDKPRPKLGGSALYLSFAFGVMCLALLGLTDEISATRIAALLIGALILIVGGILDDKYDLPAYVQIVFPVAAALAVVGSGIHISYITNPFGGEIILDQWKLGGFPVLGSLVVIFGLSLAPDVLQTTTAFLALIFAAVCFGFLPFNFHPARIFLGEGGSTFT